jgi:hypothetical protein
LGVCRPPPRGQTSQRFRDNRALLNRSGKQKATDATHHPVGEPHTDKRRVNPGFAKNPSNRKQNIVQKKEYQAQPDTE